MAHEGSQSRVTGAGFWTAVNALTLSLLVVFAVLIYLLKPIWHGMTGYMIDMTGIAIEWFTVVLAATLVLVAIFGVYVGILAFKKFNRKPVLFFRVLPWPVLIFWGPLMAILILETGELYLAPTIRYLLFVSRPWSYSLILALSAALTALFVARWRKSESRARPGILLAAGVCGFLAVFFAVQAAGYFTGRDTRPFPNSGNMKETIDYVNPLIGTSGPYEYGGTAPLVAFPFGMTHWTPMNQEIRLGRRAYRYERSRITGFLATHRPAIWMGDYGQVALMPGTGPVRVSPEGRGMKYRHRDETATPFYYSVTMKRRGSGPVTGEVAPTERCGLLRFTYPGNERSFLLVEASTHPSFDGFVRVDREQGEITGYNSDRYTEAEAPPIPNFRGYFVVKIMKKLDGIGTWEGETLYEGSREITGRKIGAWVEFSTEEGETVEVAVGTSFISLDQAWENLDREIAGRSFDEIKTAARRAWQEKLDRIRIQGAGRDQMGVFYTALYRCFLFPRVFSEYGKYYSAFDYTIHEGVSYNDYSLWDTFRALHPLLIFIAPERVPGMITSLVQMYEEGGYMPKWPNPGYTNIMIGTHADAVIADAYVKGIRGFDAEKAYRAMKRNAMVPPEGDREKRWGDRAPWTSYEARGGLTWYRELGFVPEDKTAESVSRTLEFAYGDFCVAEMARALGKGEDARFFTQRSRSYQNVYNRETGFMAPRKSDGSWHELARAGFTEGSPWTYLFCVMHDVPGLIELMGGRDAFIERLDENFDRGHYVHENEPGHHYPYLYNYAGAPEKTRDRVRHYREIKYRYSPDGLAGDEDCGQMSAWYIFSAMGFYPVAPGSDRYALGVPQFEKITLYFDTENPDRKFVITAKNVTKVNEKVKSISVNGRETEEPFIRHNDIVNGTSLEFVMEKDR